MNLSTTCNLFYTLPRLKSFPSKRYLIGIPLSPSWKAAVSMAENIMLNRVKASTQPCLASFVTGNGSENLPSFWTRASIPSWNCLTIAMTLVGQPNFAIIFHSRLCLLCLLSTRKPTFFIWAKENYHRKVYPINYNIPNRLRFIRGINIDYIYRIEGPYFHILRTAVPGWLAVQSNLCFCCSLHTY